MYTLASKRGRDAQSAVYEYTKSRRAGIRLKPHNGNTQKSDRVTMLIAWAAVALLGVRQCIHTHSHTGGQASVAQRYISDVCYVHHTEAKEVCKRQKFLPGCNYTNKGHNVVFIEVQCGDDHRGHIMITGMSI